MNTSLDLADYYSGGYFLIRADKPDWMKSDLMPDKLLSLSRCLCPRLVIYWGWATSSSWEPKDREAALRFGIPESSYDAFCNWSTSQSGVEIDSPSLFFSLEAARRFVERFLPDRDGLYLIGTGLYKPLEEAKWREPAYKNMYGLDKRIDQHVEMVEGGTSLGYEVVSSSYSDFGHSWLCSGLETDANRLFGIQPSQFELLQSREDAEKINDWIADDDWNGHHRAEPEPYDYWLLVSYPLTG